MTGLPPLQHVLVAIGLVLVVLATLGWMLARRQEATPNDEEMADLKRFVQEDFARHVAREMANGLSGSEGDRETASSRSLARDSAWRALFLLQLELHNELYRLSKRTALRVYAAYIDDAVRRQLGRRLLYLLVMGGSCAEVLA